MHGRTLESVDLAPGSREAADGLVSVRQPLEADLRDKLKVKTLDYVVLSGDFGGVRPLEGETTLTGVTRFASDAYCEGLATKDGVVPIPNVLPYDAPR